MSIDFLTTKHPLLAGLNLTNPIKDESPLSNPLKQDLSSPYLPPVHLGPRRPGSVAAKDTRMAGKTVLLNGIPYTMTDRKEETMEKVRKFYEEASNLERMLDVVEGRSKISLRLLDWLVTNYAKKKDIIYGIQKGDDLRQFMVYPNYRAQLKAYQKELFDPFCRHERIKFHYGDDAKVLRTTVGQLNFFRWAIENLVLDYAEGHYDEITNDMKKRARSTKATDTTIAPTIPVGSGTAPTSAGAAVSAVSAGSAGSAGSGTITPLIKLIPKKNKKKELSISATKTISTHEVKILVKFD